MAFGAFGKMVVKLGPLVLQYNVYILEQYFEGASFSTCKMHRTCNWIRVLCSRPDDVGLGKTK